MIFERVQAIICSQFDLSKDLVKPESVILEDFDADSLDLIDLAMSIEDEFDMEVPDEELENFRTVEDIVKYIEEH